MFKFQTKKCAPNHFVNLQLSSLHINGANSCIEVSVTLPLLWTVTYQCMSKIICTRMILHVSIYDLLFQVNHFTYWFPFPLLGLVYLDWFFALKLFVYRDALRKQHIFGYFKGLIYSLCFSAVEINPFTFIVTTGTEVLS